MRRHTNAGFIFLYVPWWVNVMLAGLCYGVLVYGLPMLADDGPVIAALARGLRPLAPYLALLFLILAAIGIVGELRRTRQTPLAGLDASNVSAVPWEFLRASLADALQHRHFNVELTDGHLGIDMLLHTGADRWVVNCRYWQSAVIDVPLIRELFGIMAAEGAVAGIFVTGCGFTQSAVDFAQDKAIHLIDGAQLVELLQSAQSPVPVAA